MQQQNASPCKRRHEEGDDDPVGHRDKIPKRLREDTVKIDGKTPPKSPSLLSSKASNSDSQKTDDGINIPDGGDTAEVYEHVGPTLCYDLSIASDDEAVNTVRTENQSEISEKSGEEPGDSTASSIQSTVYQTLFEPNNCDVTQEVKDTGDMCCNSDDNDSQTIEILEMNDSEKTEVLSDEGDTEPFKNQSTNIETTNSGIIEINDSQKTVVLSDEGDTEPFENQSTNIENTNSGKDLPNNTPPEDAGSQIPGPSTGGTKIPRLCSIASIKRDAQLIAEILGREDMNKVYDRLKAIRDQPNRIETVTNEFLETDQAPNETNDEISEITIIREVVDIEEKDIFQQVQLVLKTFPNVDANRVFNLLEVFTDNKNPIKSVIEHLNKSQKEEKTAARMDQTDSISPNKNPIGSNSKSENVTNQDKNSQQTFPVRKSDSLKNDPLYTDTLKLRSIFPDKSEQEIYAHLEVYHQSPNRLQLVMEEFLAANNDVYTPQSAPLTNHTPTESLETDSQEDSQVGDDVLVKFKRDVQMIKSVFPDCDIQYIMHEVQNNFQVQDRVAYVTAAIINGKTYPKANSSKSLQKERKRLKKLKFNIAEFLKLFPDPEATFYEEKDMEDIYRRHAAAQLYGDFHDWKRTYIDDKLKSHNYHYLPTLRDIQADMVLMGPEMLRNMALDGQNSPVINWPNEVDEFFYRELLYSNHEEGVREHFRKAKKAKERRRAQAKAENQLIECGCCFEDENLPEDMSICPSDHSFCKECIVRLVESSITEGKTTFKCLTGTCPSEYNLSLLQELLPAKTFSLVLKKTQEEELRQANIPDLVTCPFCPFATIMPDENEKVMRCQNPECLKETCRFCKELNHIPLRCNEVEKADEVKMRTFIEQKMAEAMLRTCPNCTKKYYKVEGCNKMTCVCGQSMCYVCREPIEGYDHFNNNTCGNEDMDNLHRREVELAATQAREEYVRQHPEMANVGLVNDPTKDMKFVGRTMQANGEYDDDNYRYMDDEDDDSDMDDEDEVEEEEEDDEEEEDEVEEEEEYDEEEEEEEEDEVEEEEDDEEEEEEEEVEEEEEDDDEEEEDDDD